MKSSKKKTKTIKKTFKVQSSKFQLVKRFALFLFAVLIILFNVLVKIDVKAENSSTAISVETLLRGHNEYRKENGLGELRLNNLLNISSRNKGDVMIANQCWSHYCPPGKSPWDFFDDAKYNYIFAGENLAEGFYDINTLMQAWINSKTHRDNIVKPEFTEVGFSILYGNYLNNSNNILVVVHFGSSLDGDVFSVQNPTVEITNPINDYESLTEQIDISGTASGVDRVRVFTNNTLQGEAQLSGGIFTYRIQKLSKGDNSVWVDGSNSQVTIESSKINVRYNPIEATDNQLIPVADSDNFLISADNKNLINLIFVGFLAIIFIIDIIVVSRSVAVTTRKSFSHYHLGLITLVAVIIVVGGFVGQIQNGIAV